MTTKEKFGCVISIARIVLTVPPYYLLMYLILKHIEATDTIWLLFWIYAPLAVAITLIFAVGEQVLKEEQTK